MRLHVVWEADTSAFFILTENPTAKCSRASSWKQGVKPCDWWVLCFTPSASQRVSSQGEDTPRNHLKTDFSPKTSWLNTEPGHHFFWTTGYLSATPFIFAARQFSKNVCKSTKNLAGMLPSKHEIKLLSYTSLIVVVYLPLAVFVQPEMKN